jgi:hypothetical protein
LEIAVYGLATDAFDRTEPSKASSMIRRIERAQRPHCALQPRQAYTWLTRGGFAGLAMTDRSD